jgi:hypothetical protein
VAVGGGYGPTEGMVEQCQSFVGAYGMYLCCGEEGSSNGFDVLFAFKAPQHKISSSSVFHQTLSTGSLYPTERPNHGKICCRYQDKPLQFIVLKPTLVLLVLTDAFLRDVIQSPFFKSYIFQSSVLVFSFHHCHALPGLWKSDTPS